MTVLPTLYSKTAKDQIHSWTIEIEGSQYRTIHGLLGGKMQITEWTVCYPTNEGRANYQSADDQALSEAQSLWTKKKSAGGVEDVSQAGDVGFFEPMLAQKFADRERGILPIQSTLRLRLMELGLLPPKITYIHEMERSGFLFHTFGQPSKNSSRNTPMLYSMVNCIITIYTTTSTRSCRW